MIDLLQACEIAYNHFEQTKEISGISAINELDNGWIFWGRDFPPEVAEYGNIPIIIHMDDGEMSYFQVSAPENVEAFIKSRQIDVPEKYRLQYHRV